MYHSAAVVSCAAPACKGQTAEAYEEASSPLWPLPELMSGGVDARCFIASAGVAAGIDNDVKIWAPTAVRAQEPAASPAVQRLLRDNSTGRGRSRAMQQVSTLDPLLKQDARHHIIDLECMSSPLALLRALHCSGLTASYGAQQHSGSVRTGVSVLPL